MSHQVFVDKMLFVLCTPMVFLAESSFVIARDKRHPSDGPSRCNVVEAKTQYSSGTPLRCPSDIFAPALPPFPASRYAELVSGGHLPTISVRGWTAPSLYVFLAVTLAAFPTFRILLRAKTSGDVL